MRKFSLLIVSSLVLLGTLGAAQSASAAEINPYCVNNGLSEGVYKPNGPYNPDVPWTKFKKNQFNIWLAPNNAKAVAQVTGNGILCGTDAKFKPTRVVDTVVVTTAGKGEQIRCANPANTSDYCKGQEGGSDLADGTYTGSGKVDVYCYDILCIITPVLPGELETTIDYNAANCDATAIACARGSATILNIECGSDLIWRQSGKKFALTIYKTSCDSPIDDNVALLNIKELLMCTYAGNGACGNGSVPSDWNQTNSKCLKKGKKCKKVKWFANTTFKDGHTLKKAKAKVKIRP